MANSKDIDGEHAVIGRQDHAQLSEQQVAALRESERKHRTLLTVVPDIIYNIDPDGFFLYVNQAVEWLGYRPEQLVGKHFSTIVHPDDLEPLSRRAVLPLYKGKATGAYGTPKLFDERRSGKRKTVGLIFRLVPKEWNGKADCIVGSLTSYGEITAAGHYDTEKDAEKPLFVGTVGVIKDVTERRQLEAQLIQSQKMESLGLLAGGVAHDLNNVLMAIQSLSSLIIMESPSDDSRIQHCEDIRAAARRGGELIKNLLHFARNSPCHKVRISLNDLVRRTAKVLARTVFMKIVVDAQLEDSLPDIEGVASQLDQVLMNLCLNAASAMNGTGTLTLSTKTVTLEESSTADRLDLQPGRYVRLQVIDDGDGMDAETLKRACEPFFTTKDSGDGSGLGLSTTLGTVKSHGGGLLIESQPGAGTMVTVMLPTLGPVVDEHETLDDPAPRLTEESKTGTVLIVDDEDLLRSATGRLLRKLGYEVLQAENGQVALDTYREQGESIDVVLLDIAMPVMDGIECFWLLKELDPEVRVVLFSGYAQQAEVQALLAGGALCMLEKPFNVEYLAQKVSEAIESRPRGGPSATR